MVWLLSGVVSESTIAFVEQIWLPIVVCSRCTNIVTARLPVIVNTVLNADSSNSTQMRICQAALCVKIN